MSPRPRRAYPFVVILCAGIVFAIACGTLYIALGVGHMRDAVAVHVAWLASIQQIQELAVHAEYTVVRNKVEKLVEDVEKAPTEPQVLEDGKAALNAGDNHSMIQAVGMWATGICAINRRYSEQLNSHWQKLSFMAGALILLGLLNLVVLLRTHRRWLNSVEAFQALAERVPSPVAIVVDGRFAYVNSAAVKFMGATHAKEIQGNLADALLPGKPGLPTEITLHRPDGKNAVAEMVHIPIMLGQTPAVLALAHDVTEQRAMQAQMVLADRMASLGTLAAGVVHEINTPLSVVMANVEFALRELAAVPEMAPVRAALEDAKVANGRVRDIARDLKCFSHPGDAEALVDVRRVLEFAMSLTAPETRSRARLVQEFSPVPPVRANEGRLGQVFLNLLLNAVQACPPEARAHNEIRVAVALKESKVMVEIQDNGIGIPPENLPHLFMPFFTTKPVGVGTGLGLHICHKIVSALGGEIHVESETRKGTVVRVTLPVAPESVAQGA